MSAGAMPFGLAPTYPAAFLGRLLVGLGGVGLAAAVGIVALAHDTPRAAGLRPVDEVPDRPEVTASELKRHTLAVLREPETWLLGVMLFFMTGIGVTVFGLTWGVFAAFRSVPLLLVGAIFLFSRILRGGIPLAFTVVKERNPEEASGTVIGIVNTMGWIGAAVFPVVLGAALDAFWTRETVNGTRVYTAFGYRVAFGIALAGGLVAAACAVGLHLRVRRERRAGEPSAEPAPE
ncbi:MAG: hypothetical protein V5A62_18955 [Haloarculaceae archaeon]